jgi:HD superfamily phosphodiesterase
MLPVREIEERVREKTIVPLSIAHAFDHLKRTAVGAKWFAGILGCSLEEQEKAYLSGLLHDIHRPPSGKMHDESISRGYEEAKNILKEFGLPEETIEEIALPIKKHREKLEGESTIYQSVFFADKVLENMGAMIVFRRNMYIGENPEYAGVPLKSAVIKQYEKRLNKFTPSDFPARILGLVRYQYQWPCDYLAAYKRKEVWALRLGEYCYEKGKSKSSFVESVESFEPWFEKDSEYKKEAMEYIQGKKFKQFGRMIG